MIGICIFKEEYKGRVIQRRNTGEGRSRETIENAGDVLCMHTWSMKLYALLWTARSLRVSLWAKLHLLTEMREQKEKTRDGEKRNRERVQRGE